MGTATGFVQKHPEAGTKLPKCLVVSFQDGKVALKTNGLTLPIYQPRVEPIAVGEGRNK